MPITPKIAEHIPQPVATDPEVIFSADADNGATTFSITNHFAIADVLVQIPAIHGDQDWALIPRAKEGPEPALFKSGYRGIREVRVRALESEHAPLITWHVVAN